MSDDDYPDEPDCMTCDGTGAVFGDELSDPLLYEDDKLYTCPNCNGSGLAADQTYW